MSIKNSTVYMCGNEEMLKKAAIHNLGCKVNSYEAESMELMLKNAGYEIVPFDESDNCGCIYNKYLFGN